MDESERATAWHSGDLGMNPGWPLTSCVTVAELLPLSGLRVLICKMGSSWVPSQGSQEELV